MSKRRTHSPEFKAKVAMEAISGSRAVFLQTPKASNLWTA
jgi:hypothetical protein